MARASKEMTLSLFRFMISNLDLDLHSLPPSAHLVSHHHHNRVSIMAEDTDFKIKGAATRSSSSPSPTLEQVCRGLRVVPQTTLQFGCSTLANMWCASSWLNLRQGRDTT